MNREQRAKPVTPAAAQKGFHLSGIEIEGARIYISKHRTRAGPRDGAGRGEKAERRGENLISGLHSRGCESQPQSVRAGGATHRFPCTAELRKLALESLDLRPQNVVLRRAHTADRGQHFGAHLLILALQVEQGHLVANW